MKGKFIMKRPRPIKPFKSLDDEANFWDTHDVSAIFKNGKISLSKLPLLEQEKGSVLTIRIQNSVKKLIEKIAQLEGVSTTTLSRMWIIEKLREKYGKLV